MLILKRRVRVIVSSKFLRVSVCLVIMGMAPMCSIGSSARTPDETSVLDSFRAIKGELSEAQAKAFYDMLAESRLLDRPKLSSRVIEDIGDIIVRTNIDDERQQKYVDGFGGLWSRIGIDVDPMGFANLEDRLARKQGKPQSFGTLVRSNADYADVDAQRIYAAAREMIGMDPKGAVSPVQGKANLSMAKPVYPELPIVRAELLRLGDMDQEVRREPPGGFKGEEEKAFVKRMQETDAYTLPKMRSTFDEYGIPSARQVGRSGTHAAFLLIQHAISDPSLMRSAVPLVKRLRDRGDLPGIDYALLADRVDCVLDHRPQQFGTQGNRNPKSPWFCPIDAPEYVNQRRASIYLPSMADDEIFVKDPGKAEKR